MVDKPRITVASCVSNVEAYETCVLGSISCLREYLSVDILPIYNHNNLYSASIAANLGFEICKTRYFLYVHQDVKFLPGSGKIIADVINRKSDDVVVIGAAGVNEFVLPEMIGKWGVDHTTEMRTGSVYNQYNDLIWDGMTDLNCTQSVDEMFMLIDRKSGLRFDPSWAGYHFYGLDFCLQARSAAFKIASAAIPIQHCGQYSSSLYQDSRFFTKLITIFKKWSSRFSSLCAPYCHWDNNRIVSYVPLAIKNKHGNRIDAPRISVTFEEEMIYAPDNKFMQEIRY